LSEQEEEAGKACEGTFECREGRMSSPSVTTASLDMSGAGHPPPVWQCRLGQCAITEQPERRDTLIAPRSERDGATIYTFDIHLQGACETVFFDV
jgi:protocatechuate 3,4-dioxygenase beta subunit